jgi:hypothetical protein
MMTTIDDGHQTSAGTSQFAGCYSDNNVVKIEQF